MPLARLAPVPRLLLSLSLFATAGIAQAKAPERLALLVGIDRYAQPDKGQWHTLRGCENDVKLAREVLLDRFGFQDADIVTLASEKATHAAIVKAFHEHLVKRAGPETKVVFWFSGHGSQVPDPTQKDRAYAGPDEPGKDQTMLAYDSRRGAQNGSHDLSDDEIHSLLAAVRSRDVLFVSDCCHSGGLARGGESTGVRGEADGDQPLDLESLKKDGIWPKGLPLLEDDAEGRLLPHVVHVAACAAEEEAGEFESPSGMHGTLSWFLCQTLREVPAETSWRVVVETVRARIAGRLGTRQNQRVDVHGDAARAVLGGTARPVPAGYLVEPMGNGTLRVHAGTVHGIGSATTFDLCDQDGKVVAKATPTSVTSSRSTLQPLGKVPYGRAIWARPTGGLDGRATFGVRLPSSLSEGCLAGTGFAAATKDSAATADYVLEATDPGFRLVTRDGLVVGRTEGEAGIPALLFQESNFRFLWDAVGARGERALSLRATAVPAADSTIDQGGSKVRVPPARLESRGASQRVRVAAPLLDDAPASGGLVFLEVTNDSDEDLHLAVLSVQEDRAVTLVFGKSDSNVVRAGKTQRIRVQVGPSKTWTESRPMVDRYVAFATPRWVDFAVFERTAPTTTRGGDDEGPSLFRLLNEGETTRGGDAKKPWGLTWLDLELTPPKQGSAKNK